MEHILKKAVSRTNKRKVIRQLLLFAKVRPIYQRRAHKYIKRVMRFGAGMVEEEWDGKSRSYLIQVPEEAEPGKPVIISFPGVDKAEVTIPRDWEKGDGLLVTETGDGGYTTATSKDKSPLLEMPEFVTRKGYAIGLLDDRWVVRRLGGQDDNGNDKQWLTWIHGNINNIINGFSYPLNIKELDDTDLSQTERPYLQLIGKPVDEITLSNRPRVDLTANDWVPYLQDEYSGWGHTAYAMSLEQLNKFLIQFKPTKTYAKYFTVLAVLADEQ